MTDGSNMVAAATLIGDYARAKMLTALMGGRALTATELAGAAGITKQTGSTHLRKLLDARFVAMEAHGRHRYFRIADEEVAQLLEDLMSFSVRTGTRAHAAGPKDPALRKARVCYDHLAGELGVLLYASLLAAAGIRFQRRDSRTQRGRRALDRRIRHRCTRSEQPEARALQSVHGLERAAASSCRFCRRGAARACHRTRLGSSRQVVTRHPFPPERRTRLSRVLSY